MSDPFRPIVEYLAVPFKLGIDKQIPYLGFYHTGADSVGMNEKYIARYAEQKKIPEKKVADLVYSHEGSSHRGLMQTQAFQDTQRIVDEINIHLGNYQIILKEEKLTPSMLKHRLTRFHQVYEAIRREIEPLLEARWIVEITYYKNDLEYGDIVDIIFDDYLSANIESEEYVKGLVTVITLNKSTSFLAHLLVLLSLDYPGQSNQAGIGWENFTSHEPSPQMRFRRLVNALLEIHKETPLPTLKFLKDYSDNELRNIVEKVLSKKIDTEEEQWLNNYQEFIDRLLRRANLHRVRSKEYSLSYETIYNKSPTATGYTLAYVERKDEEFDILTPKYVSFKDKILCMAHLESHELLRKMIEHEEIKCLHCEMGICDKIQGECVFHTLVTNAKRIVKKSHM